MRELRGLNYGDYAYIEYFPNGMYQFEPDPNIARHEQIFQIWIRPVEPANAVFALRLAMYELDKLVKGGISPGDFEKTRSFLSKYVNILTKTKSAELGYAIDSQYYGMPEYNQYLKAALAKLTVDDESRGEEVSSCGSVARLWGLLGCFAVSRRRWPASGGADSLQLRRSRRR